MVEDMLKNIDVIEKLQLYSIIQPTPSTRKIEILLVYLLVKYSTEIKMADCSTSPYCVCVKFYKECYYYF